ncbi:SurA N-terminal domain-containing protein [Marinobacteraceae bacterium S3BR75-40.1]
MLQDIRNNAQGTIAKIIVVLLVLGLSAFGMKAIIGSFGGEPSVATVNGSEITERDYEQKVQMARQQQLQQMEQPDPSLIDDGALRKQVLQEMIEDKLLYQDATARGLMISDAAIDQIIRQIPQFQVDGQFDQDRFMALVRNRGFTIQGFREQLRRDYLKRQIQIGVAGTAFVSQQLASDIYALQEQSRSLETLKLGESLVADSVTVSDDEIQSYYDNNPSQFQKPESVDVAYLVLDREDLKSEVDVSEQALRDLYEKRLKTMEGREEREAAHILIAEGSENAEADVAAVEKGLEEGKDFAALAKEYSDDIGSAENGGNLGYATKDAYVDPFAEALFGIEEPGKVVGPIKTQFGQHFIKLLDIRRQDKPSFAELKAELEDELLTDKADKLFSARSAELADDAYTAYDLKEPADKLGLEVHEKKDVAKTGGEGIFASRSLINELFSAPVLEDGHNTELVEVSDGKAVVARVLEHHDASEQPLSEVKGAIEQQLRQEKVLAALKGKAEKLITQLQEGDKTPEAVAEEVSASWENHDDVKRGRSSLPPMVVDRAFEMPEPQEGGVRYGQVAIDHEVLLIGLKQVKRVEGDVPEQMQTTLQNIMARRLGQEKYQLYVDQLKREADIERL